MKKVLIIILILVAGFIIWKREPWMRAYYTETECKNENKGNYCQIQQCDLVQTVFWLDCPHGSTFWTPIIQKALY